MATWSVFYPDIAPKVLGCPYPTIDNALLRASQGVFRGADIWRAALTPVTVLAGDSAVAIGSAGGNVWRLESALADDECLEVMNEVRALERFGTDWETVQGTPKGLVRTITGSGRLVPIPTVNVTVKMSGLLYPADGATGIPDDLYNLCSLAITSAALAFLFEIDGQPWSNERKALKHYEIAQVERSRLAYQSAKSFSSGRVRSTPKWF